jgi:molybdopterin converting factor small subunit
MITVKVRYFNLLALHAGTRQQLVEMPGDASLTDLILKVAAGNPPSFREVVFQNGLPSEHLRVFHNGTPVFEHDLNLQLADGDEVMLFPAVAGGIEADPSSSESGSCSRRSLHVGGAAW